MQDGGQNIRLEQLATEASVQLAIFSPTQELVESTIAGVNKTNLMLLWIRFYITELPSQSLSCCH